MPTEKEKLVEAVKKARAMGMEKYVPLQINKLRKVNEKTGELYPGVHSVYSGLSKALETVYEKSIVDIAAECLKKGIIETRPVKGGYMWYVKGQLPAYDPAKKAKRVAETAKKVAEGIIGAVE